MMDASLWDGVVAQLSAGYRCVAPTLPLGGAPGIRVRAGADLSLPAIAWLAGEFLDRLDLHDVTLVGNDTGGALVQLLIRDGVPRAGRVVLVSCDAFDNFPPGLTGKTLVLSGKLPPRMFGLFMQQMRLRAIRRLPIAFGWLTRYGDAVHRPVDAAGHEAARDPPRRCADAAGSSIRHPSAGRGGQEPAGFPPARPGGLGPRGPRDAPRARTPPHRPPAPRGAG